MCSAWFVLLANGASSYIVLREVLHVFPLIRLAQEMYGVCYAGVACEWMIVRTALNPSDSGRSVIKSIATIWKGPEWGLVVIGCNGAFRCVVCGLFCWQMVHPRT